MKLVVVDYGAGNLHSVSRAVVHGGVRPLVTSSARYVAEADALIVPGVGAAADTMANLVRHRLVEPIREYIASGKPFLGVCMGQQALFDVSEEGGRHECLGIMPGRVVRLPAGLKVPHMGWNQVRQVRPHPIFDGIPDGANFTSFTRTTCRQTGRGHRGDGYGVTFPSVVARTTSSRRSSTRKRAARWV